VTSAWFVGQQLFSLSARFIFDKDGFERRTTLIFYFGTTTCLELLGALVALRREREFLRLSSPRKERNLKVVRVSEPHLCNLNLKMSIGPLPELF
jgi:hypothetical protein